MNNEPLPSRLISPALLLGACVWLLASWVTNAALDSAFVLEPQSIAFAPSARGLLISMALGGMIAWPAWRLSQPSPPHPLTQVIADLFCLVLLTQVVLWPLRFGADWALWQTLWINATLLLWLTAAALMILVGWLGRTAGMRTSAFVGCLLLLGGGYLAVAFGGDARLTPTTMLWLLANPGRGSTIPDLTPELAALATAVALGAVLVAALAAQVRSRVPYGSRRDIMDEEYSRTSNRAEASGAGTMQFITGEEKAQLEQKLEDFKARRPEITNRIAEARALGDLKENAEYHAAREEQGLVEAEIRRLEERLKNAKVSDEVEIPEDMVFLGATVKLRDVDSGDEDLYRLVGEASGNFDMDIIEVTAASPMGEALMKARVGETVRVDLPRGTKRFEILELV